jgi:hypothetical protein
MQKTAQLGQSETGTARTRIAAWAALLLIPAAVALSACGGTNPTATASPSEGSAVGSPQPSTSPAGQQVGSDIDKAAAVAVNQWLQMFSSSQTDTVTPCATPDLTVASGCRTLGTSWQATATIAIADLAKVGGHTMNGADIVSGTASSQTNFIKATVQFRDGNPEKFGDTAGGTHEPLMRIPDFTATVELRQISVTVSPSDALSGADQANGFTYKGSVKLTFVSRYAMPANATPLPYSDDGAVLSLIIQNGQAQTAGGKAVASTVYQVSQMSFASTHTANIFYPAAVFARAEGCASAQSQGSACS